MTRRLLFLALLVATLSSAPAFGQGSQKRARGLIVPPDIAQIFARQSAGANTLLGAARRLGASAAPAGTCSPLAPSFDLRADQMATAAADQGYECQSCWAFAAASAMSSSFAFFNRQTINPAVQELLDCTRLRPRLSGENVPGAYTCAGGFTAGPFDYAAGPSNGVLEDNTYVGANQRSGYQAQVGACMPNTIAVRHRVTTWAPVQVDPTLPAGTQQLKESLCAHGGVVTAIDSSTWPDSFQGGILIGKPTSAALPKDHVVQIVGWNDNEPWSDPATHTSGKGVWIVKNSWGSDWGDKGFVKIPYDHQSIGALAIWALVNLSKLQSSLPEDKGTTLLNTREAIRALNQTAPNLSSFTNGLRAIQ